MKEDQFAINRHALITPGMFLRELHNYIEIIKVALRKCLHIVKLNLKRILVNVKCNRLYVTKSSLVEFIMSKGIMQRLKHNTIDEQYLFPWYNAINARLNILYQLYQYLQLITILVYLTCHSIIYFFIIKEPQDYLEVLINILLLN